MLSHVAVALSTVLLLLPAAFGANSLDIQKGAIVHLFEWKWEDIARECEEFLGPKGYAAVQTSPPHENLVKAGRPWNERLQVVSYKLVSRSGNEEQLIDMLRRCNKVGVRVFAHAVINHMTEDTNNCEGVGGSKCDAKNMDYPAVPYKKDDFNKPCTATDVSTAKELRECDIFGYHDLNQKRQNVRDRIVEYLNHLISIGFAGFRIDAAMHMYPADLKEIYNKVDNLNSNLGLPKDTRPFIYQEVFDLGLPESVISYTEYTPMGLITDATYSMEINAIFKWRRPFSTLKDLGGKLAPDLSSVVAVDGYDTERETANKPLTYKTYTPYKMAIAFMLAWGHGYPLILSGYKFEEADDGPPADKDNKILSPDADSKSGQCKNNKWVCQHRWRQVYSMVAFNQATLGTPVKSWWDNGNRQMAFSRGNKGFVAFNMEQERLKMQFQTNLPAGKYCDVISGLKKGKKCEGKTVEVNNKGLAMIDIQAYDYNDHQHDGVLAIFDHESSRL